MEASKQLMGNHRHTRSILHGYQIILTRLLVLMGISTFTSKEFSIFCRVSKIGNAYTILYGDMYVYIYTAFVYIYGFIHDDILIDCCLVDVE